MSNADESKLRRSFPVRAAIACVVLFAGAVSISLLLGRFMMEKLLTSLVLPCGLLWLLIGCCCFMAVRRRNRRLAFISILVFATYTLAGNAMFADWLVARLEQPYYGTNPRASEPFDVLIVLGGGADHLQSGSVELGSAGDRLMLAARLFHLGKARHLVATGAALTPQGFDPLGSAKAAERIWRDLDIPSSSITLIGGRNTSEEMRELRRFLNDRTAPRVGLLTSAWHLPRALRLARKAGLDVVPVPADFETQKCYVKALALVPSASGFKRTELAVKEFLAYLVNR